MKTPPRWIVSVMENGEISVLWSDNEHGQCSWGWPGPDKFIIHERAEQVKRPISNELFDHMKQAAEAFAYRLNLRNAEPKHFATGKLY